MNHRDKTDKAKAIKHENILHAISLLFCGMFFLLTLAGCHTDSIEPTSDNQHSNNAPKIAEEKNTPKTIEAQSRDDQADENANQRISETKKAIKEIISGYEECVSVVIVDLESSARFDINGEQQFPSASMIKLPILAKLLTLVDSGDVSLEETYTLNSADIVYGTGYINAFAPGTTFTLKQLAEYMIVYSDNTATNVLIERVGMNEVNAYAQSHGLKSTVLQRMMMDLDSNHENYMSANDAASILENIYHSDIASEKMCQLAQDFLSSQTDKEGLEEGIPKDIKFAHKTGTLDSVRHDGGIVYANRPYVIVVFTSLESNEANRLMSSISSTAYESLSGK